MPSITPAATAGLRWSLNSSGQSRRLTCQYHGWSYDHEGELRGIRDPQDFRDLDMSCRGLKRVRCERFGNLVFVNFDAHAPTLLEWLGPSPMNGKNFSLVMPACIAGNF